jgi:hypothetical protein
MNKTFIAVVFVTAAAIAGALYISRHSQHAIPASPPSRATVDGSGAAAADASAAAADGSAIINVPAETQATSPDVDGSAVDAEVVEDERIRELENRIRQYIAQVPDLRLTSLNSVQCDETQCEIVFTGTDANPQFVDQYMKFSESLWRQVADDGFVEFLTGGMGTREVVAGAKEYVMGFTYVAIDSPSTDSREAARQHAACAGAWQARADEARSRNLDETELEAREMAERELAIATPILGQAEADRIAKLRALGPLLSECVPARMFIGDRSR